MGTRAVGARAAAAVTALLVGFGLLAVPPASASGDWPTRHGDQGNTGATGSAISTDTVSALRASWAAVVEPDFRYEPVVLGDQAFVSCLADDPRPYRHCAIGTKDGSIRWRERAMPGTAAVDGRSVYVTAAIHPAELQALDAATGARRWGVELEGSQIHMGPQLAGDLVLVSTMAPRLHALDAATGATRWVHDGVDRGATPAVVGEDVFVPAGALAVLDRRSGAHRWTGRTPTGAALAGSPLVHRDLVIVGSRGGFTAAYDARGCGAQHCDPVWTTPHPTLFSPSAAGEQVFIVSERELIALDAATGAARWRSGHHSVMAAPVAVAGDVVFATSSRGTLDAYDAAGCGATVCDPVWSARIDEAGRPASGPIAAGDAVYVTGAGALLRFSLPGDGPAVCPPGPPVAVSTRHDASGTVVEWERPGDDGGAPVAVWRVTAPDGTQQTIRGAETRTAFDGTLSGEFSVQGENAAGPGPAQGAAPVPCDPEGGTVAGAPREPHLHPGDGALLATWKPPLDDGGQAIDHYAVTLEAEDGQRRTLRTRGERTWLAIGDVGNGIRYRMTVTAGGPASAASSWAQPQEGAALPDPAPGVARLRGADRITTAVAISSERFADGQATGAVIARADDFPDALTGTPLAVAVGGPLLLSHTGRLPGSVVEELQRVLPPDGEVRLLGGTAALSSEVERSIEDAGFTAVRIAGADRYETAVAVARSLGSTGPALLAVGTDFPDALTAGAAAARHGGVVLLTAGEAPHPVTSRHLQQHDGDRYAVGGAAARAHPDAVPLVGATREETAVAVADRFFPETDIAGLARRDDFADALVGAGHSAALGAPVLLTPSSGLHGAPDAFRCRIPVAQTWMYGGRAALGHAVAVDATSTCEM